MLLGFCTVLSAWGQNAPTAQDILRSARLNQSEQHRVLSGRLRIDDHVSPFRLTLDGQEIRYEFAHPPQTILLRLDDRGSQLFEEGKGGAHPVSPADFAARVRDTDITFEDLALRFLYWPKAKIDGEETKLTRKCWKLHLEPGNRSESRYAVVLLWVEKQSGAFLQAEGYDAAGKISKRFKVVSAQRAEGGWILKQMRIEELNGMESRDKSPTYLEIDSGH